MSLEGSRRSARLLVARINAHADELLLRRYPGDHPGPELWLGVIQGVLDTAAEYLDASEDTSKPPSEAIALLRDAGRLAVGAYGCIELMSGAGMEDLPFPVVLPLQGWFERTGLKNTTIFRARLVANYEIRAFDRQPFDRIRNRSILLNQALSKINWPLRVITVPARALGMLPYYAIVAHEIGHALFKNVLWDFSGFAAQQTQLLIDIGKELGSPISSEIRVYISEVFQNWLQEIISDAFGHLMAGPAFFFALCGFFDAHGGGIGISETHPANALRRELLFERLTTPNLRNFSEVFRDIAGRDLLIDINSSLIESLPAPATLIADLTSQLSAGTIGSGQKAVVCTLLSDYMRKIAARVYEQAEDHLRTFPDVLYTPSRFEADLNEHLKPLLHAIPPIETRGDDGIVAADFATILNVGWVVLLAKLDDLGVRTDPKISPEISKAEKLHSLLIKAVELSEARRTWEH